MRNVLFLEKSNAVLSFLCKKKSQVPQPATTQRALLKQQCPLLFRKAGCSTAYLNIYLDKAVPQPNSSATQAAPERGRAEHRMCLRAAYDYHWVTHLSIDKSSVNCPL